MRSGRCQNASDVLREGLILVEERQRIEEAKLKGLKRAIREGQADVAAGRHADVAENQLEDFVGQLGPRAKRLAYERDDGPLTAAQVRAVRKHAKATLPKGKVRATKSLF